jgi:predicted ATPase
VLAVAAQRTRTGASIVIGGAPGIGKTFLVRRVLDSLDPGTAQVLRVAGASGRRSEPFAVAVQLLRPAESTRTADNSGEAAFDLVDEMCAAGPVVLWCDDAHHLDAASLGLLRRLVWASRSLPLAVVVTTRPSRSGALTALAEHARLQLRLAPMGPKMAGRLVFDQTGRWPGPLLRRILRLAAGNPLFIRELLHAYEKAGALGETGPDAIDAGFELDEHSAGLDDVLRSHLRQLDGPARDVLAAMAVWGTDIEPGDLAAMVPDPAGRPRRHPGGPGCHGPAAGAADPRRRARDLPARCVPARARHDGQRSGRDRGGGQRPRRGRPADGSGVRPRGTRLPGGGGRAP